MNMLIIDREAREMRLRNAAARLAWQNHGLYRISLKVRAFYRGESSDLPKAKHRLERALDPKRNGADAIIDEFAEALKLYLPDEIPRQPLRVAYYLTLKLIECGIETVHRHNCLNHLETPGYSCNPLSPRVRARGGKLACVCAYEEAARRALQLCDILGLGTSNARFESSFRLWGFYCRHFDWWRISEKAYELASRQRQGEIRDAVTSFQKWLGKNFPKKV